LNTSSKEVIYVDALDTNTTQDPNQPKKVLAWKQSFDSFGFNFGILLRMY